MSHLDSRGINAGHLAVVPARMAERWRRERDSRDAWTGSLAGDPARHRMRPAGPGKPHSEHCKRGAKGAGGGCEPQAHDFRILRQAPGGCRQPATGQSAPRQRPRDQRPHNRGPRPQSRATVRRRNRGRRELSPPLRQADFPRRSRTYGSAPLRISTGALSVRLRMETLVCVVWGWQQGLQARTQEREEPLQGNDR